MDSVHNKQAKFSRSVKNCMSVTSFFELICATRKLNKG